MRDQIEEKKRRKDEEKRGDDRTKQKEMREYLTGHYKGEIPERLKSILVVDGDNSDGDMEHQQQHQIGKCKSTNSRGTSLSQTHYRDEAHENRNVDGKYGADGLVGDIRVDRQAKKNSQDIDADNYQGQYSGSRRDENRHRSKSSQEKRGVSSNEHSTGVDDDPEFPDNRGARRGYSDKNDKSDYGRKHQFQDKNGRWIGEVEYGELTSLCDRLMTQQDQLQVELQHQAQLIKVIDNFEEKDIYKILDPWMPLS